MDVWKRISAEGRLTEIGFSTTILPISFHWAKIARHWEYWDCMSFLLNFVSISFLLSIFGYFMKKWFKEISIVDLYSTQAAKTVTNSSVDCKLIQSHVFFSFIPYCRLLNFPKEEQNWITIFLSVRASKSNLNKNWCYKRRSKYRKKNKKKKSRLIT